MPRKHLIASKTNKQQQNNAKLWQKLVKEIRAAVSVGGQNPDTNPRLKAAIDRALDKNLSKESIEKNIKGVQKDSKLLVDNEYEIFGPQGVGIIVHTLTDNQNRVMGNINGYISKLHGSLGKQNSVKPYFNKQGKLLIKKDNITENQLIDILVSYNVVDIHTNDDSFEIIVDPSDYYEVKATLIKNNLILIESDLELIPVSTVEIDSDTADKLRVFINSCEQDDDIQWVVNNAVFEE